jgi:hypothetical protein
VLLDRGRSRALAWASIGASAIALALVLILLWADWDDDHDVLGKSVLTATVFAIAGSQASATTSRRRAGDSVAVGRLYVAGVTLMLVVATMAAVSVWAEIERVGYYRALGALAVLAVLVTLLQPLLARMARAGPAEGPGVVHRIRITFADGRSLDREARGRDFADAVAKTVREAELEGAKVTTIERLEGASGPS